MESVPVAERLLQTKLFGIPVRRLGQTIALPLAPALLTSIVGFPLTVVGPLLLVGLVTGATLFYRIPQAQSPAAWIRGTLTWLLGPAESFWQPIRQETSPAVWIDRFRSTGAVRTRDANAPASEPGHRLGNRNTIDGLDFHHVREDGVIATETGFARILELEATPWLILDDSSRTATIRAFERYLSGIGSPVQFVTLPVPYDVDPLRSAVLDSQSGTATRKRILDVGRSRHADWLQRVVHDGEILDRRHFLVVSVPTDFDATSSSDAHSPSDGQQADSIAELDARAENARSSLPRTGVSPSILDDRASVLEVLYLYYRGDPPPTRMDHGWLTSRQEGQQ